MKLVCDSRFYENPVSLSQSSTSNSVLHQWTLCD